jgi:hypothetical protein
MEFSQQWLSGGTTTEAICVAHGFAQELLAVQVRAIGLHRKESPRRCGIGAFVAALFKMRMSPSATLPAGHVQPGNSAP